MEDAVPDLLIVQKLLSYHVQIIGLLGARWFGFFFIFPIIIWAQVPPMTISVWAFVFTFPLLPGMASALSESNITIWPITSPEVADKLVGILERKLGTLILLKEFMIGVMLGFFPAIFFFGFIMVGEIADQARGDIGGKSADGGALPMTDSGTILFMAGSTLFLTSGEFINVIRLFMMSYEVWPLFEISNFMTAEKMYYFLEVAMKMLFSMSYLAIPFVLLMWSYDIQTAFQARTDKKFQAQEYQFALKNFTFLAFMILYLKTTDLGQYNPTMSIATNFSVLLEAGGHGAMHGR
ncbi:MAG: type III secretory pathway component EscT [Alphaproteobacteria bacterium]|jgi:type III secretory pathway component EscT